MQTYSILSLWALLARRSLLFCFTGSLMAACSDGSDRSSAPVEPVEPPAMPFQELFDQGLDRYLGEYTPMVSDQADGIVTHTFGAGDGPLCLDGSEYRMATLNAESEDLMIFLQGGGACWSELCLATASAPAGIPQNGFLNPNRADNPVNSWNVAYFPYCDGSLFAGDVEVDRNNDGVVDRQQRGLANLTASVEVIKRNFPELDNIVISGSSAGGFGTILATPMFRLFYPEAQISVFNDAGAGICRPGDSEFIYGLFSEWDAGALVPPACPDCFENGHLTDLLAYELEQDDNLRIGVFSSAEDGVIAGQFMRIPAQTFATELRAEADRLHTEYPERYAAFLVPGTSHTAYLTGYETTFVEDVRLSDWVNWMIEDDERWDQAIESSVGVYEDAL